MNALSFRLSSWYSSGIFILIVVVLISVYTIVSDGVSPFITALLSSIITLLVSCGSGGDYDSLLIALGIKPGAYSLGGYNPNIYGLSV